MTVSAAPAVQWQADLVHSRAQFTVSHLVVSQVWGHIPIQSLTVVNRGGSIVPQRIDAVLNVMPGEDTDNHDRDHETFARQPTST